MVREHLGIGLLLFLLAGALAYQAKHLGLTTDEPSHFAAGYSYWLGNDALQPSDTPPLTRAISGWVPRILRAPNPTGTAGWATRDAYLIGAEILGRLDIRARRLLFYSRLPFIIFPLLIVYLIWHWGRRLFGGAIALTLAACGALEPTILGHGALIKSDVPAAFAALWFAYAAWKYWGAPTRGRLLTLTLTVVVAALAKFTLLPLFFAGYCLSVWRGPRRLALVAMPLALYAGILAFSQFRAQPVPDAEMNQIADAGIPRWALPVATVLGRLPWPPQFVRGLLYVGRSLKGEAFTGYMLGRKIRGWVPAYFPLAWAIKFPIPLQALTAAGIAAFVVRVWRRQAGSADLLIWGLAAFFFGTAMLSNFHIGFRHVLPALPFFILGGGFALERWRRWGRLAIAIGLIWLAVSSLRVYPNGISYFNEWIGGPANGWKYLADSNIDWGQNLPELGVYLKRNRIATIDTFISSFDNPWHYCPPGSLAPQPWPAEDSPPHFYKPRPGIYAISVNVLTGLLLPNGHENDLDFFRNRRPDDRAGYSILIYNVK